MLTTQQKLDFVHKQTKIALEHVQHFDQGGTALGGPTQAGSAGGSTQAGGIIGGITNFLGEGNNYTPGSANIQAGTNTGQLNQAYKGTQGALGQAGNLTGTLTPGVAQGVNTQNTLTEQLQNEALGRGPNPAQNMLNQATGQNINQAAALAAGVRGAGANAGLVAQNAAAQGANTTQQAIGQAATQEAQQQLNAQNALGNLAAQQVGQGTNAVQLNNQAQQNEQNILQGANTATNNQNVSMQENINNTQAQIAQANANANANTASGIGGALQGVGSFIAGLFAEGGKVKHPHLHQMASIYHPEKMAEGGVAPLSPYAMSTPATSEINAGQPVTLPQLASQSSKSSSASPSIPSSPTAAAPGTNPSGVGGSYGLGGQGMSEELGAANSFGAAPLTSESLTLPELGSSAGIGSAAAAPSLGADLGSLAADAPELAALALKGGGKVPGKPKVNHDAYKNDTVDAKLSPGEVVIDINTLKDKGKLGKMARFVAQNIERKKIGRAV